MNDTKTGLKNCVKCGNPGLGEKEIICARCVAEIFGDSKETMFFCKKCRTFWPMDAKEKKTAEKTAGVDLAKVKGKILMVLDSCHKCYKPGDSTLGQFALLTEMTVH